MNVPTSSAPKLLMMVTLLHFCLSALLIPPWEGHDEPMHYEYIAVIQAGYNPSINFFKNDGWFKRIPERVYTSIEQEIMASMSEFRFWRINELRESETDTSFSAIYRGATAMNQAPLYYWLCAACLDLLGVKRAISGLYICRGISLLIWSATIFFIYLMARSYWGRDNPLTLFPPFLALMLPMPSMMAGVVNNDALANFFYALALLFMLYSLKRGVRLADFVVLVLITGCALQTKRSTFSLILLLPLFALISYMPGKRVNFLLKASLIGLLIFFLAIMVISSPLGSAFHHHGTSTASSSFMSRFTSISNHITFFDYFFRSFLGSFVWGHHFMDMWVYGIFLLFLLLILVSLTWGVLDQNQILDKEQKTRMLLLFITAIVLQAGLIYCRFFWQVPIWNIAQGRFLFVALGPLTMLAGIGFQHLVPEKKTRALVFMLCLGLFLFDFFVQIQYIFPYYYMYFY